MYTFSSEIALLSNTSKPSRSGTRTKFNFWNLGFKVLPFSTSVIRSRAALLPMSMAASFNLSGVLFRSGDLSMLQRYSQIGYG
jgi:hypothetical protein